jgi:asparagine synthase (glutamine-hydrolysing)
MSGILGFAFESPQPTSLERLWRALRLLEHRGLEGEGVLLHGGPEISRFPLTPGSGGTENLNTQPFKDDAASAMLSCCQMGPEPPATAHRAGADNLAFLAFDGRLDNEPELRRELQALGHDLRNDSPTEVLGAVLERWGSDSLARLAGTFAVAFLNLRTRRLLLARDPYGTRPLYFAHRPGWGIYFASQIGALLEVASLERRVNRISLYRYLAYNCMDHAPETFFEGIEQVPAGGCLEIPLDRPTEISVTHYRRAVTTRSNLTPDAAAQTLREMVVRSVASQVTGHQAVGAALSGGFDSSFVVAALACTHPREPLRLYTCVPTTKSGLFSRSEERWAVLAAASLKSPLYKICVASEGLPVSFESIVGLQEEPFSSPVVFAQWQLFRAVQSDGVGLMLSGQGGDTVFQVSKEQIARALLAHLRHGRLRSAGSLLRAASQVPGQSALHLGATAARMGLFKDAQAMRKRRCRPRTPDWLNPSWFVLDSASIEDRPGIPMLRFEDRNASACSIVNRMPLLTPEIHGFITSLPPEFLVTAGRPIKSLECAAMRGMVPEAILERKERTGFPVPVAEWLVELAPWVDSLMAEVERFPFLEGNQVRQIWQGVRSNNGSIPAAFLVWRWIFLVGWLNYFAMRLD